jgi:hypothetical protein
MVHYNVSLRKGGLDYIYIIMKIIITEGQYKRLFETEQEQKVFEIPSIKNFGASNEDAWENLQKYLQSKGNPPFSVKGNVKVDFGIDTLGKLVSVKGNLNLRENDIWDLGELKSVGGYLDLMDTYVNSGSLGNLEYVGGDCDLFQCRVDSMGKLKHVGGTLSVAYSNITSLGELKYVGGNLDIFGSRLLKKYSEEEIRSMVEIKGDIVTIDPYDNNVIGYWG